MENKVLISKELSEKMLNPEKDPDGKLLFEYAKKLAEEVKSINSNQIRKYFSEVKKISMDESKFKYEVKRFLAVFLYNIKKLSNYRSIINQAENFANSMKNMVLTLDEGDINYLKRFKDFWEALVAYHKYLETTNKRR
ncbi:hypothetical protein XJ44_00580 [Thermosipho affectus]|uniref:CRISPR system Cms protein Csm2 n=1 Tax=Thermosipho affectus TaxID=660294 RepID=A0ABX3ILM1_9BACT|nr:MULTISPECIES: type III-A CRISPR-associated protein Csm2 [Thermosipho]ANQ54551.1 hypothetical protein Y592_00590 [Thermosipho sp. 1070]APT72989.1 hypothetical protein BG95_00585 [Thermosipho sp. 1063]ONN28074.1 hypothetical protein XJ44_00580 [Thermosipho affectus]OOC45563.1 hypothetical protein XO08_00595 [Thermosipho sp. 1074]